MYWGVVEAKPLPDYRLFAGALSPLRDVRFFEQVFLDRGAVAWPGEIDLAPDAMYEEVARQPAGAGRSR
jgi:hypothetical protein